jgi:hypothetical protein
VQQFVQQYSFVSHSKNIRNTFASRQCPATNFTRILLSEQPTVYPLLKNAPRLPGLPRVRRTKSKSPPKRASLSHVSSQPLKEAFRGNSPSPVSDPNGVNSESTAPAKVWSRSSPPLHVSILGSDNVLVTGTTANGSLATECDGSAKVPRLPVKAYSAAIRLPGGFRVGWGVSLVQAAFVTTSQTTVLGRHSYQQVTNEPILAAS